jgi:hypothetical protein
MAKGVFLGKAPWPCGKVKLLLITYIEKRERIGVCQKIFLEHQNTQGVFNGLNVHCRCLPTDDIV